MKLLRSHPWRLLGLAASVGLAFTCSLKWKQRAAEFLTDSIPTAILPVPRTIGFEPTRIVTRGVTTAVHSATVIELPNGDLRCYWFGGTKEGAPDVSVWTARWDHAQDVWETPSRCVDRRWLEDNTGLNIRKLGNPVAVAHGDAVELFVVGVAVGGWSGSNLYHLTSADGGLTFTDPHRLAISPFFNLSTLVRSPAVQTDSPGHLLIPAYHELVSKYPLWIGLNEERQVSFTCSAQQAKSFLQPCQIHLDGEDHVFLRNFEDNGSIHIMRGENNNDTTATMHELPVPNPNSAVTVLALDNGVLLACNDIPDGRDQLSLLFQHTDSLHQPWHLIHHIDTPERQPDELLDVKLRYAYPWLMQTKDGYLHVFYSWNSREIRHLRFDARDWPASLQPATR